jgi:hypothetical protein
MQLDLCLESGRRSIEVANLEKHHLQNIEDRKHLYPEDLNIFRRMWVNRICDRLDLEYGKYRFNDYILLREKEMDMFDLICWRSKEYNIQRSFRGLTELLEMY